MGKKIPTHLREGDVCMDNEEGVTAGAEDTLKRGEEYMIHNGHHCRAYIWWGGDRFYGEMHSYGTLDGVEEGATLAELRERINWRHGWK